MEKREIIWNIQPPQKEIENSKAVDFNPLLWILLLYVNDLSTPVKR